MKVIKTKIYNLIHALYKFVLQFKYQKLTLKFRTLKAIIAFIVTKSQTLISHKLKSKQIK